MARLAYDDVEDAFARVQRLGKELDLRTEDWVLVHGELAHGGQRRTTYRVLTADGNRLFSLGYTRRSAVDALSAIATAFEVVLAEG